MSDLVEIINGGYSINVKMFEFKGIKFKVYGAEGGFKISESFIQVRNMEDNSVKKHKYMDLCNLLIKNKDVIKKIE